MAKTKDITLEKGELGEYLGFFEDVKSPFERYASFDYCFNYFQGFKNKAEIAEDIHMRRSCLELGFYLASWGMYRGSTFVLQKSVRIFEPVMKYIASDECDVWGIDVDNYDEGNNIEKLVKCSERIKKELGIHNINGKDRAATETLITKIMLGVFGNVPAFDSYFRTGSGLGALDEHSLGKIKNFYEENKNMITRELKTFHDESPEEKPHLHTDRHYTKAKLIDMIFFTKGLLEATCWGNYTVEKSETHGDAIESALEAGYKELRSQNIMNEEWFIERQEKLSKKKEKVNRPNANNLVVHNQSKT